VGCSLRQALVDGDILPFCHCLLAAATALLLALPSCPPPSFCSVVCVHSRCLLAAIQATCRAALPAMPLPCFPPPVLPSFYHQPLGHTACSPHLVFCVHVTFITTCAEPASHSCASSCPQPHLPTSSMPLPCLPHAYIPSAFPMWPLPGSVYHTGSSCAPRYASILLLTPTHPTTRVVSNGMLRCCRVVRTRRGMPRPRCDMRCARRVFARARMARAGALRAATARCAALAARHACNGKRRAAGAPCLRLSCRAARMTTAWLTLDSLPWWRLFCLPAYHLLPCTPLRCAHTTGYTCTPLNRSFVLSGLMMVMMVAYLLLCLPMPSIRIRATCHYPHYLHTPHCLPLHYTHTFALPHTPPRNRACADTNSLPRFASFLRLFSNLPFRRLTGLS